jgi:hypothetical protein
MMLDWRALWRASVILFFAFAIACPLANYRDSLWLVILSVGVTAPVLLLASILLITGLIALLYRRARIAFTAIAGALVSFLSAVLIVLLHPNLSIFHTTSYGVIDGAAFLVVITMPMVLLCVPIAAVLLTVRLAVTKRWKGVLSFAAVPLAGGLLFYLSSIVTGLLTVWSCVGPIQSALQTVKAGAHLPKESQRYPIAVLHIKPDVAVEELESFMDFPGFIAFDTEDLAEAAVAARVQKSEAPACTHAGARKVWGNYYWVSIAC